MVKREIIWTKTAEIQLVGILEFWVHKNKSKLYSKKLLKLVTNRTNQIAKTPYLFRKTSFQNIRVASLGNFSIFYKVTDSKLIIMAFWDNRQDPKKLLAALKNE